MPRHALVLVSCFTFAAPAGADNWPAWRGPTGQGFCSEKDIPLEWSAKKNVKWKVPLAHPGNSTPVVWADKIFLTQANKGGTERSLLCLARADGKVLWQRDVAYPDNERNWNENWYCNASPAVDGERVVVSFASAGMYCFDFDGKELWKRTDLGKWEHAFGSGSSPVLHGDLAILWCGPNEGKGRNFLLAVNKKTGETVWEHDEKVGSWGTPLVARIDGKDQLLLSVVPFLKGFDLKDGKELWSSKGLTKYVYTSPLFGNGVAVSMSGYGGAAFAVKLGGSGDITADRLWHHPMNTQRVGSGMIVGDHCYMVDEDGVPHCYELKTGDDLWVKAERPKAGSTWGSMVHAEGRLYVLMRNAETLVFAADPTFKLLARNPLGGGEATNSSPAISNGDVFIRTFKHLWCIQAGR
ncbi:MAG: PQQ-binding-like beta-propeller repeat protein [Gemmataceae bacterium]